MPIEKDNVVRFHYTLSEGGPSAAGADGAREMMESSKGGDPLAILIGHNNIIPGLENALLGHEVGDTFAVDVPAAGAYGERQEHLTQRVPKKAFGTQRLEPGAQVMLNTNAGQRPVTVQKVGLSVVDVDLNHPMAGRDLHFEIEVVEVRPATTEEIGHGHAHAGDGHSH